MQQGGNPNDIFIKINALLEEAKPRFSEECCIYKVPNNIRKLNEDAYTPQVVSIGPFHHANQNLQKMEDQKRLYCRQFIERSETKNLESLVSCVQEMEEEVRSCYSDDIKLSKEEHVMLILVDSCFILEFLLRFYFLVTRGDDSILLPEQLLVHIRNDLLLVENQVPFFVLDKLYYLSFPSTLNGEDLHNHPPLLSLTCYILPGFMISEDNFVLLSVSSDVDFGRIAHFVDLTRKLLLKSSKLFQLSTSDCSREAQVTHIYSASELNELGVKFEVNKNTECLLDITLSGHTLRIPFIRVHDWTELVLRNLLAFEQCHCIHESYLTDYTLFLDFLINTDKDVDLLIKKGIIENWLGDSNAVAKMFNGLAANTVTPDFNVQYSNIFKDLNAFCAHPWNKKVATLKRDYCNTPWKTVASIAAIFLLILTIIQTIFSILQVVH
ncbi:hypothetical protein PIB30_013321 [Stylosanthes scabra]|uniref:Uncharacterized protein n=1 Tax=Stylosanthes scabra TaxID=79078 RepID=A0ABU6U5N9_9FABA|nr:hypothetical protein [Stylosanthes scabra]